MNKTLLFLILTLLASCKREGTKQTSLPEDQIMHLPENLSDLFAKKSSLFSFDDFYETIDGFKLDISDGVIGGVHKLGLVDSIVLILDRYYAKKIFAYELQSGTFLFSIGKMGKGPGEFIRLGDFAIDKNGKRIVVCDWYQNRISYFNYSGEFINSVKIDFYPIQMAVNDSYYYFLCENPKSESEFKNLKITNSSLKISAEYAPSNQFPIISWPNTTFYNYKNNLFLYYPLSDTIYQLTERTLTPYTILDAGGYSLLDAYKNEKIAIPENFKNQSNFLKSDAMEKWIVPNGYFEVDGYSYFRFTKMNRKYCAVKNKKTNGYQIQGIPFYNPFIPSSPDPLYSDEQLGDFFVFTPDILNKVNLKTKKKNMIFSERFIKYLDSLDVSHNPYIVIFK